MAFIVLEGLDHSGKTTLIQSLSQELKKKGIDYVLTREPGGTALGELVRERVLNPYGESVSAPTELLLICASRRDHIEKVITPTLQEGKWLICDRFWPSTYAFQGAGRGMSVDFIDRLNKFTVPSDVQPDLWILLDMPVTEKDRRSHLSGHTSDRFEMQDRSFHQRIREYYLSLAEKNKESWLILNALLSKEKLTQAVLKELKKRKWLSS